MNGGTVLSVQGGGMASGKIDGINYSVGNKDDAINSSNRTDIANIVISGGKITYGLLVEVKAIHIQVLFILQYLMEI